MEVYPLVNIPNNWALNVWIAAGQPLPGRIARNTMGNFANYSICRRWATSPKTMFLMHSQISIFSSGPIVSSEQTNLPKDRLRPGNVNTGAGQTQRKLLDRVASMPTSACVECNSDLSTNPIPKEKQDMMHRQWVFLPILGSSLGPRQHWTQQAETFIRPASVWFPLQTVNIDQKEINFLHLQESLNPCTEFAKSLRKQSIPKPSYGQLLYDFWFLLQTLHIDQEETNFHFQESLNRCTEFAKSLRQQSIPKPSYDQLLYDFHISTADSILGIILIIQYLGDYFGLSWSRRMPIW
jgi:hypothetical protein